MSEQLAQLEKKGGGNGELFLADFTAMSSNVSKTITLEKSAPNIKKMVVVITIAGGSTTNAAAEFDVNNTTITQNKYVGNNWYQSYYWITLNGDQLTVRQTYTQGNARILIYYI